MEFFWSIAFQCQLVLGDKLTISTLVKAFCWWQVCHWHYGTSVYCCQSISEAMVLLWTFSTLVAKFFFWN